MILRTVVFLLCFGIESSITLAQTCDILRLPPVEKKGGMPLMEALGNRRSSRSFSAKELPLQKLSGLLWAAYGVNRAGGMRTVPSAHGWNEFDIYVVKPDGWYLYHPEGHTLQKFGEEDIRGLTGSQDFVAQAPLNLIYVADYERMKEVKEAQRGFYSAADAGFISQNVYLYCASEGFATVVRGAVNNDQLHKALKLRAGQHIVLAQTVGFPE